jgi:hypothetical protein
VWDVAHTSAFCHADRLPDASAAVKQAESLLARGGVRERPRKVFAESAAEIRTVFQTDGPNRWAVDRAAGRRNSDLVKGIGR